MRVSMYAEDYEPMVVLDVRDQDLDTLRRGQGDAIRVVPRYAHMDYRAMTAHEPPPDALATRTYTVLLAVEGMRWADRRVRPILVARGLRLTREFVRGHRPDDLGMSIFQEALAAARQRTGAYERQRPPQLRVEDLGRAQIISGANTVSGSITASSLSMMNSEFTRRLQAETPRIEEIARELRRRAPDMVGVQVRQDGERFYAEAVRPGQPPARLDPATAWPVPQRTALDRARAVEEFRTEALAAPDPAADIDL